MLIGSECKVFIVVEFYSVVCVKYVYGGFVGSILLLILIENVNDLFFWLYSGRWLSELSM